MMNYWTFLPSKIERFCQLCSLEELVLERAQFLKIRGTAYPFKGLDRVAGVSPMKQGTIMARGKKAELSCNMSGQTPQNETCPHYLE